MWTPPGHILSDGEQMPTDVGSSWILSHPEIHQRPLPRGDKEMMEHLTRGHGEVFLSTGQPPAFPDEAEEHLYEIHDELHQRPNPWPRLGHTH